MAMVNQMMAPIFTPPNMKDSRWLTLEVCREYQRNKCTRSDVECKFAHPPPHVEVQNGRVTCCFDSIKGKCQRKDPPCKYLHPPQHLREQLLQNGRNNLILRNLQMQALTTSTSLPPMMPGMYPGMAPQYVMQANYMNQVGGQLGVIPSVDGAAGLQGMTTSLGPMAPQHLPSTPGVSLTSTSPTDVNSWTGGATAIEPTIVSNSSQYSPVYFQGMPGMMPMVKRPAFTDVKSGMPVYTAGTGNNAYQHLVTLQPSGYTPVALSGHPPGMPRF